MSKIARKPIVIPENIKFSIIDYKSYEINQLKIFKNYYLQSMLKKNANKFYFFNEDYFNKIALLIKNKK